MHRLAEALGERLQGCPEGDGDEEQKAVERAGEPVRELHQDAAGGVEGRGGDEQEEVETRQAESQSARGVHLLRAVFSGG